MVQPDLGAFRENVVSLYQLIRTKVAENDIVTICFVFSQSIS